MKTLKKVATSVVVLSPFILNAATAANDSDTNATCFYGLNVNDTTAFDSICINDWSLVASFSDVASSISDDFFSSMGTAEDMDYLWVLMAGALVFFMQCGFTMLEAGAVKSHSTQNILFKNVMDACIGAIVWYLFGYSVAYGNADSADANGFIGVENVTLEMKDWNGFFFQWAFAATAATIVSGSVAERCSLEAYFIYTVCITVWVYPVVVHWIWDGNGWLSAFNPDAKVLFGCVDFAGSGVVHMVGGWSGLMGAIALGPRFRRFDEGATAQASEFYKELRHVFTFGHNVPFQVLGTFILWFGWYGFNAGSTLGANGLMNLASKVAVTTTLSAAAGGVSAAFIGRFLTWKQGKPYWPIPRVCNGILAGLVAITAGCAVVGPGSAICIGVIGTLVYYASSIFLEVMRIDDPLDAWPVHGVSGAWGVIAAGLFAEEDNLEFAGYASNVVKSNAGERFLVQLCTVVVVAGWTVVNSGLLFFLLKALGILRISEQMERTGLDEAEHGGKAVTFGKVYAQLPVKKAGAFETRDEDKFNNLRDGSVSLEEQKVEQPQQH